MFSNIDFLEDSIVAEAGTNHTASPHISRTI